jgi:hypothetical protein
MHSLNLYYLRMALGAHYLSTCLYEFYPELFAFLTHFYQPSTSFQTCLVPRPFLLTPVLRQQQFHKGYKR